MGRFFSLINGTLTSVYIMGGSTVQGRREEGGGVVSIDVGLKSQIIRERIETLKLHTHA